MLSRDAGHRGRFLATKIELLFLSQSPVVGFILERYYSAAVTILRFCSPRGWSSDILLAFFFPLRVSFLFSRLRGVHRSAPRRTQDVDYTGRWRRSLKSLRFLQLLGIPSLPIYWSCVIICLRSPFFSLLPRASHFLRLLWKRKKRLSQQKKEEGQRFVEESFSYGAIRFFGRKHLQIKRQRARFLYHLSVL